MVVTRGRFMRSVEGFGARSIDNRDLLSETAKPQVQGGGQRGPTLAPPADAIQISYNENPLGPSSKALEAKARMYREAGRYPFNSVPSDADLAAALARKLDATPGQAVLGAGRTA